MRPPAPSRNGWSAAASATGEPGVTRSATAAVVAASVMRPRPLASRAGRDRLPMAWVGHVALDHEPGAAPARMLPELTHAARHVLADVDVIEHSRGGRQRCLAAAKLPKRRPLRRGVAPIAEFGSVALAAIGAGQAHDGPQCRFGCAPLPGFIDQMAGRETVEAKGRVQFVRLVVGDRVGEAEARSRRSLEAAIAPAAVEIEPRDRRSCR